MRVALVLILAGLLLELGEAVAGEPVRAWQEERARALSCRVAATAGELEHAARLCPPAPETAPLDF